MIDSPDRRVVVIGGGIFGTSTAAELARRGAAVTLVTEAGLASGASGRSLGWLNAFGDHPDSYVALRREAMERYRRFLADNPNVDYVRFAGAVWWGTDESETEAAFARLVRRNYPVRRLERHEAVRTVPGLSADGLPASVLLEPHEGWVELARMVPELARRFAAAGGSLMINAGPAEVEVTDGRVAAVLTQQDRVPADVVVVASGASVPAMLARITPVPDATPVALLVRTGPVATDLGVVVNSPRAAFRPAPGGRLVVDHDWAAERVVETDGSYLVPPEVVEELLGEASKVLTGHPPLQVDAIGVGPKPVPGDGLPVIGQVDGVEGCYVAFSHSGATLGLLIGELLAAEILDGVSNPLLQPFRPQRFRAGAA